MSVYEFQLQPQSPWSTPWHADTLWGSLCWAWLEAGGPGELQKLLAAFASPRPPFVISDALPVDLMPYPIGVKPPTAEEGKKTKTLWCRRSDFQKWSTGETLDLPAPPEIQRPFATRTRMHVRMNRNTSTHDDGGLFEEDEHSFQRELYPDPKKRLLSVYVRLLPENSSEKQEAELLHALQISFELLGAKGYGRKASTGLGTFSVVGQPARCDWLDIKQNHTGFVSLSHFVPATNDPTDGFWKIHVKNPKFASNMVHDYLKGNLITLVPGSNFCLLSTVAHYYGRMISMHLTEFPNALHYGLAFVAPILRASHSEQPQTTPLRVTEPQPKTP